MIRAAIIILVTLCCLPAGALTDQEKIRLIMTVAKPAQAPRNFYRWQSEVSGRNLLAAGVYNEELFNRFMSMTLDKFHFAGGHGIYFAEDIVSSAGFIRGDAAGTLIEIRIPKGMPVIDVTKDATVQQLKKLGVTVDDVLFLNPPLAVRYGSEGWWAVKRREGVKFQPFNPASMKTSELLQAFDKLSNVRRAADVLEPFVEARIEKEVAKDSALLLAKPELLKYVSTKTFVQALVRSSALREHYQNKLDAGHVDEIPIKHLASVISTLRETGISFDESKAFQKMDVLKKLAYLDASYAGKSVPKEIVEIFLGDGSVRLGAYAFSQAEKSRVEGHILEHLKKDPKLLIENRLAFEFLSSDSFRSILHSSEEVRDFYQTVLERGGLTFGSGRNAGLTLDDFKKSGVRFDEARTFFRLELHSKLEFLNYAYPGANPPAGFIDDLLSPKSLNMIEYSQAMQRNLRDFLDRSVLVDGGFLAKNPISVEYLSEKNLTAVLQGRSDIAEALKAAIVSGKMSSVKEVSLQSLSRALQSAGVVVTGEDLFKNFSLEAKLTYLEKTYGKQHAPPHLIVELANDSGIRRNAQFSDAVWKRVEVLVNGTLERNPNDLDLIKGTDGLFGTQKVRADGRALVGFETRTREVRLGLSGYAYNFFTYSKRYDGSEATLRGRILNSLVAGDFESWKIDHLYDGIAALGRDKLSLENQTRLETRVVAEFQKASAEKRLELIQYLERFVPDPSLASARIMMGICGESFGRIQKCAGSGAWRFSVFEKSAQKIAEHSSDEYVRMMTACLGASSGCWMNRALYVARPPADLSQKQVLKLVEAFGTATDARKNELRDVMVTVVVKHWRKMPEEFKAILGAGSGSSRFREFSGADDVRIRRAEAIEGVANDLVAKNKFSARELELAGSLNSALRMDIAHERDTYDGREPDYRRVSALEAANRDLFKASFAASDEASAAHLATEALEAASRPPETVQATSEASVFRPTKNSCSTFFQKIGALLMKQRPK